MVILMPEQCQDIRMMYGTRYSCMLYKNHEGPHIYTYRWNDTYNGVGLVTVSDDEKHPVPSLDTDLQLPIGRGFVVRLRRTVSTVPDAYFNYCKENKIPYIEIIPMRIYAEVHFDAKSLESVWYMIPDEAKERFSKRMRFLYGDLVDGYHHRRKLKKGSFAAFGPVYASFTVYEEYAVAVAIKILLVWDEECGEAMKKIVSGGVS